MNPIDQIKRTARKEAIQNPRLAASIMESARNSLAGIAAGENPKHILECFLGRIDELKGST